MRFLMLLFVGLAAATGMLHGGAAATEPYKNPNMANSTTYEVHTRSRYTPLEGPSGPGRRLEKSEITWKPLGPDNGFVPLYSSPYPNGKRVVWVGGYDRVAKLDADTLETLTTHAIGGTRFFTEEETIRHIEELNRLDHLPRLKYMTELREEAYRQLAFAFYRMLSKDNELYIGYRHGDGAIALRVYGEADSTEPSSPISLRREWKIPPEVSTGHIYGMTMIDDGWLAFVTTNGKLVALATDFSEYQVLDMPRKENKTDDDMDLFKSFLRNGIALDDRGGLYVVTRDYMHRMQWTGKKLSLDEADGAWKSEYPNELGIGSGTTPALMGWGPDEDHLVVIADGTRGNNMLVFWRDEIPDDWQGLPGQDRRIAGMTPVRFGVSDDERPQVENSIVVNGYGAFLDNYSVISPESLPDQGSNSKNVIALSYSTKEPGYEPFGGTMIRWDPEKRKLETAWNSKLNFARTICTASGANQILYCWGARDGEWTLEGLDWNTGNSNFHYTLGSDQRYNPNGAPITIAPNGAIDCGCRGGLGMVRVNPKQQ